MAKMTMELVNELLADGAYPTNRTVCGRRPAKGLLRVERYRGKFILGAWNYAHGKWEVRDRSHGYGSADSIIEAAKWCPNGPITWRLRDVYDMLLNPEPAL